MFHYVSRLIWILVICQFKRSESHAFILKQLLFTNKLQGKALSNCNRGVFRSGFSPIACRLLFFGIGAIKRTQHDNQWYFLLPYHLPESRYCRFGGALRCNESRWYTPDQWINQTCVYVGAQGGLDVLTFVWVMRGCLVYFICIFFQSQLVMFKWQNIVVPI